MKILFFAISLLALVTASAQPSPEPDSVHVTLRWTPPTTNTDGTTLTDLTGYKVYFGTSSGARTQMIPVAGQPNTYTVTDQVIMADTQYFFAVTAVNSAGRESAYSNESSVRTPAIPTTPNPPTGVTVTATLVFEP